MSAEVADILLQAKNNLIDFGIGTGSLVSSSGCVCALGAIYLAEGIIKRVFNESYECWECEFSGNEEGWDYPETPAVIALAAVINHPIMSTATSSVYHWNDRLAPEEQLSAVFDSFDTAIAAQLNTD